MLVDKIISMINDTIAETVDAYKLTSDSVDDSGNYIPHPLEAKTDADKLDAIDFGLRESALNVMPVTLIETAGSTADEFRPIDANRYIRVPTYPALGNNLDIDESLVYAVYYKALSHLWSGYGNYETKANSIYANYKDAMRDYFLSMDVQTTPDAPVYFRYSPDGTSWHDVYQDGDIYISIKQGDGVWSNAIRFVGEDGAAGSGGGGASAFTDLTDTPSALTADKWFKVNADGTAIVETDAPVASLPTPVFNGEWDVSGSFSIYPKSMGDFYYFVPNGDTTIDIAKDADGYYDMFSGYLFTLVFYPSGHNVTLAFDAIGDKTINSAANAVFVRLFYDGGDIYIYDKKEF